MVTKHIPQRTCIACRTVRAKRELVRIVHTPANRVLADLTGKQAGRGAYLCRHRECWESALDNRNRLEQALKLEMSITLEDLAHLREFVATLPPQIAAPKNETR